MKNVTPRIPGQRTGVEPDCCAAALIWCIGRPKGRSFISGDSQLLDAARQLGFLAVAA
jgi:hypothetical protein